MAPATARHIIIGDVHGMLPELNALLGAVELRKEDVVVFLGDLIDKGPDSPGVVARVRELREGGQDVRLVKGNHEEKHERFRRAFAAAGDNVKMKGLDELKGITAALSGKDIAFLETAEIVVKVPGGVAVHAGVLPTTKTLDLATLGKGAELLMRVRHVTGATQASVTIEFGGLDFHPDFEREQELSPEELVALLGAERRTVVKTRYRPAGSFITLKKEGPGDPFWADVYDGRFGHVYFGHTPYVEDKTPREFQHAVGLDLGAVFGNRLAAAVLTGDGARSYVSVPAGDKFSTTPWEE